MTDPNAQAPYPNQAGQPYQPPAGAASSPPLTQAEDKQWAMLAHFGGILWILPSLIIYLVFKDRGPFTRQEAKEALNWQITFLAGYIVLWVLVSILTAALLFSPAGGLITVLFWLPGLWYVVNLVLSIMGGIKVNSGAPYRYPFAFRLIK